MQKTETHTSQAVRRFIVYAVRRILFSQKLNEKILLKSMS